MLFSEWMCLQKPVPRVLLWRLFSYFETFSKLDAWKEYVIPVAKDRENTTAARH